MTANHNRLRPAWHQTWDIGDHDWLTEHDAAENVADRAIWRTPHLLQAKLFNAGFVRRDRGAFDSNAVLFGCIGCVDGDLVVRLITLLDRQVVIFEVDVEIRMDQPVLDHLPDDAGHFVPVHLDDRIFDLDFRHVCIPCGCTILAGL